MALFTRIVLLTLVSSEISLGQRKHGRTFPVAADVKPGLNFDCPEEFGYYPHPNDCTQYYVCVFGGALLESCTGGLMYSHELQTCDWPRNVGCDSGAEAATTPSSTYSSSSSIRVQEPKVRYTHPPPPPPPAQPAAIVTSRGQPRQLQHNQQDLIKQKQQQQLYDEADDALPPAEEIENDRQQRVYRGQPSTIGQVQKDRDGLRHHTNAIPSSSNGVEKIGVISFGSQPQSLQEYRNLTDDIDNFLTNDLTFKRRKRQIKQSHHRFEPNVRQPFSPYQLPASLNVRPYSASYSNNRLNNYQNQYETNPDQDQLHNDTPHYVPYSNVNFSVNVSPAPDVLKNSSNQHDSAKTSFSYRDKPNFSIFNSARIPLPIPELHHPFKLNVSYNIRATPNSLNHHISPTTEYGPVIKYRPALSHNRPVTLPKDSNRDPILRQHNYNPSDNNIKELKQLIDALTSFRNLQLFLKESQNVEKKPIVTSTPKNNFSTIKISLPKLKANETINANSTKTVEKTTPTNIEKINKTKENVTHTDDAYYYYDDDEIDDEIVSNKTKSNSTSKYIPFNTYNNTETFKKINPSTPKNLLLDTTTAKINHNSKYPNQPKYYPTTVRIPGKLTPSFSGPFRMPLPNTRHNVNNYRHRHTIPTINWHKYNNYSSNYSPYNKSVPKRVETQSNRPVDQVYSTVRSKPVYNNSQSYDSRYDPYYDLYEELDPELYKSVEYTQHYNNDPPTSQQTYRSTTVPTPTQVLLQEKIPKRGNSGYNQNSYSTQDSYRPSSISSYEKDERYNNNQDDGQGIYQQTNKQQSSSAESHEVQGTFPNYKLQRNSEYIHTTHTPNDTQIASDIIRPFSISLDVNLTPPQKSFIEKPIPFALPLDAVTPQSFHYVTKLSKSTSIVSTSNPSSKKQISNCDHINCEIIIPTTYSPSTSPFKYFINAQELALSVNEKLGYEKPIETIDIQESINEEDEKDGGSVTTPQNNFGGFQTTPDLQEKSQNSESNKSIPYNINSTSKFFDENLNYLNSNDVINENIATENSTSSLIAKQIEISPRPSPTKSATKKATTLSYYPTRVSRVNMALKSVVSFGGLPRPYTKCSDDETPNAKCKKDKKRVNNRGRGSSHYSNSGQDEGAVVNRGTSPPRSRPTLKPSTSIVSKASEFIDIYKNPPRRPDTIYPQPQPDKTAAKCRKDVCLLPDCSCGGKEIPGDLDVSQVPQMVLLTFDDAVNDLNMGYYAELFEKGRVNPNGCPIAATFYVSHEWTDYSQVQNLYADGHEMASHTVSHSFGEQFSQKKWTKEIAGQREILSAYGGVRLEDVRGMRAPFLSVGGNKMFKMLYDSNFTYDSSMPIYENKPPSWPYTLDYKLFHDCMIPPCPTRSYPGVWEVPMVMWQDLNGGRCSMGDACSNPSDADGVFKMLMKNFDRHYTTNRAPFGLFYHAAWFTQPHHKEGFIHFLDTINTMDDVWLLTNWQAIQWVRDPTPISRLSSFQPFGCNYPERPKRCNNPKVCNLWHKTGVRYMRTCQPCPDIYPWTGNTGIRSSRIDNEIED